jgi:hypothetical protein
MNRTIAAVVLCSIAVGACTRIIERPAPVAAQPPSVVSTPAIVERTTTPAPAPAAGATAPASCSWASQNYSSGALSCQDHAQFRCNAGTWEQTNVGC